LAKDDVYRCRRRELAHHFTADEDGQKMRIYLTKACRKCPLKDSVQRPTSAASNAGTRHVVEACNAARSDPQAMRVRRETVEHPFGTLKMRMGRRTF